MQTQPGTAALLKAPQNGESGAGGHQYSSFSAQGVFGGRVSERAPFFKNAINLSTASCEARRMES